MRSLAITAFLVTVLAGCADVSPAAGQTPEASAPFNPLPGELSMLAAVDLQCPEYVQHRQGCAGFGEPTLEVAGDGTIWYSAVCCVGQSPPIWTSRDNGSTFQALPFADRTGAVRDAFGVEGDFAIDDEGNVFFFDISAGTSWFTKFQADGSHVFTKADPFPPLVDRPWVRAGVADEVFIVYNSGIDSWFYRSTDGGLTWSYPGHSFGCNLAGFGQGAERDHLLVHACDTLWQSDDGGVTWGDGIKLETPNQGSGPQTAPFADGAGNAYIPQIWRGSEESVVGVAVVRPDGSQYAHQITTAGLADYPWLVAGAAGNVAVAYYGSDKGSPQSSSAAEWRLRIAYSGNADEDGATWKVIDGDPDILFTGSLGRQPGDFLQIRHTPEGDLAVAYAARVPYGGDLVNRFVRSTGADLGHDVFRNGPTA